MNPRAVETLENILSGAVPYPGMWETVPVRLESYARGEILMSTMAGERHLNAFGGVHGGYAAAALDTALGLAVFTSLEEASARHTTVDLGVKIVKRIPLETALLVETALVHLSRSVGVSQGVIRDAAGVIYAHGTTTCLIKRAD